jgi:flagellar biosynthesis protein FlhG
MEIINMDGKVPKNKVINLKDTMSKRIREYREAEDGRRNTRVIAVASGKGGVGKTNIVANVGYALSRMGKKVLLLDADLGLGNIDILLGIAPKYNLSHVLMGKKSIEDIVVQGPAGMTIIPAASGLQEMTQLTKDQQLFVLRELEKYIVNFDVFLMDTAAGISSNVLSFNASAHDVVVIVSPEPTAITDAYALIKILSHRYDVKKFNLIVNMASSEVEGEEIFRQLTLVTDRFLDIGVLYCGCILKDKRVTSSVKQQKLVSEIYPDSISARCFRVIAGKYVESEEKNPKSSYAPFNWHKLLNTKVP